MLIAMILGIIGCALSFISFFFAGWLAFIGLVLGIIALVFAVKGRNEAGSFDGKGIAGLITGIIAIVLGAIAGILYIVALVALAAML